MQEIEIKLLEIDADAVIAALESAGAKRVFYGDMQVIYFDYPDGHIKNANELMRLRKKGDRVEMVYKKNLRIENGHKVADEYEVIISDFDTGRAILQSLGLKEAKTYQRHRTQYEIDGVSFMIDEFPGIPVYMEIEGSSQNIENWVERLELGNCERSTETFDQLAERYLKK